MGLLIWQTKTENLMPQKVFFSDFRFLAHRNIKWQCARESLHVSCVLCATSWRHNKNPKTMDSPDDESIDYLGSILEIVWTSSGLHFLITQRVKFAAWIHLIINLWVIFLDNLNQSCTVIVLPSPPPPPSPQLYTKRLHGEKGKEGRNGRSTFNT